MYISVETSYMQIYDGNPFVTSVPGPSCYGYRLEVSESRILRRILVRKEQL
jgi:hypothetical protein